jgi:hypothetical protein
MRRPLYEVLAAVLILGGVAFFVECCSLLVRRDYVAAIILFFVGNSVCNVGAELARLALVQRE